MPHALQMMVVSDAVLEVTTPLCLIQTKLLVSIRLSNASVDARQLSKTIGPMDVCKLQPDDRLCAASIGQTIMF